MDVFQKIVKSLKGITDEAIARPLDPLPIFSENDFLMRDDICHQKCIFFIEGGFPNTKKL